MRVSLLRQLEQFLRDEDGPTAVEYAVMLAMLLAVCIVAIGQVGSITSSMWGSNDSNLNIAWNAGSAS